MVGDQGQSYEESALINAVERLRKYLLEPIVSVPARTKEKPSIPRRFNAFSSSGILDSSKSWNIVARDSTSVLIPLLC